MEPSLTIEYNQEAISYDDNPDFNQEIDDQEGGYIEIAGSRMRPSLILFKVDPIAYHTALVEFRQEEIENFKEVVFSKFPTPISFNFERFERGYENQQHRLRLLQDTWESIIYLLYALILGEFRYFKFSMLGTTIKPKQIVSDSLADRLSIIEQLVRLAIDKGYNLPCLNYISIDVVERLRELNRVVRNSSSHSFSKVDAQCRQVISEYKDEVLKILRSISEIRHVILVRYVSQEGSILSFRHEDFRGASLNRTFDIKTINPAKIAQITNHLNNQNILAICDEDIYCVSPFLHFKLDEIGNPKLCFYKKKKGRDSDLELMYEVLDGSGETALKEEHIKKTDFNAAIDEIKVLLPDLSGRGDES